MPNPQQLKERIYALNPELKDLTMGCEIECNDSKIRKVIGVKGDRVKLNKTVYSFEYLDKSEFEIIGHPITLNEVIYAMREQDGNQDNNIVKLCGGSMSMWNYKWTFDQNIAENEELVTFLLNIIK